MSKDSRKRIEIFYDGSCRMCSGLIEAVEKSSQGSKFEGRDITRSLLPQGVSFAEAWKHMHLVTPEGETLKGGKAFARLLREYPRWRFLAKVLSLHFIRTCVEIGYDTVAAHRHKIPWLGTSK